jgi:hypothetical protein
MKSYNDRNFDNLFRSVCLVFQVVTAENWNEVKSSRGWVAHSLSGVHLTFFHRRGFQELENAWRVNKVSAVIFYFTVLILGMNLPLEYIYF